MGFPHLLFPLRNNSECRLGKRGIPHVLVIAAAPGHYKIYSSQGAYLTFSAETFLGIFRRSIVRQENISFHATKECEEDEKKKRYNNTFHSDLGRGG